MPRSLVYTDGACRGNPGPGGWAWVMPDGAFAAGPDPATTNQRMEITAALEAVRALTDPLEIVSDSTYVVNCFRDRWWEGWLRRGWITSARKPVANRDLWEPLVLEVRPRDIVFRWIKGHTGDRWNDLADRLAVEAATTQEPRKGESPPATVGDRSPASGERAGHRLVVIGHRPPELGGYGETEQAGQVRRRLTEILVAKQTLHSDLSVLTGLGLGVETLAAEAARDAGVPYTAVLAFPHIDRMWPADSRRHHTDLVAAAESTVTLQKVEPDSRPAMLGAFGRRDVWLHQNAAEAVAVWDGIDGSLGRQVRALRKALGEENVWVVDPSNLG